jgi:hypothetical protein
MLAEILTLFVLIVATFAQFPPEPEGITTLKSKFGDGVSISYKQVLLLHPPNIISFANCYRVLSVRRLPESSPSLATSISHQVL